ncbi:hypothetical protein V6Z11_A08G006700 [Gossypium hirsutum]
MLNIRIVSAFVAYNNSNVGEMRGAYPHMIGQRNVKALILSVSVLVAIEIFNSLNILSQVGTLFAMPPWGKL